MSDDKTAFKVVDLAAARRRRREAAPKTPKITYFVRVEIDEDAVMDAFVLDLGDDPTPAVLRAVAADLRMVSWNMLWQAHEMDPQPSEHLLAEVRIFESSRIMTRMLEDLDAATPAQRAWLSERMKEAEGELQSLIKAPPPSGETAS